MNSSDNHIHGKETIPLKVNPEENKGKCFEQGKHHILYAIKDQVHYLLVILFNEWEGK